MVDKYVPPTDYLGHGTYGYVYIAPIHSSTLKVWPTVIEDLKKWLEIE